MNLFRVLLCCYMTPFFHTKPRLLNSYPHKQRPILLALTHLHIYWRYCSVDILPDMCSSNHRDSFGSSHLVDTWAVTPDIH